MTNWVACALSSVTRESSLFSINGRNGRLILRDIQAALPMLEFELVTRTLGSCDHSRIFTLKFNVNRRNRRQMSSKKQRHYSANSRLVVNGQPSTTCWRGSATRAPNGRIERPEHFEGQSPFLETLNLSLATKYRLLRPTSWSRTIQCLSICSCVQSNVQSSTGRAIG